MSADFKNAVKKLRKSVRDQGQKSRNTPRAHVEGHRKFLWEFESEKE